MRHCISIFAQRPWLANGLMLLIILLGIWSIPKAQREILPRLQQDGFTVTLLPEQGIEAVNESHYREDCLKLEHRLQRMPVIERLHTLMGPDHCTLAAELPYGTNVKKVVANAKKTIRDIPLTGHYREPVFEQHEQSVMISRIAVTAKTDPQTLNKAAHLLQTLLTEQGLGDVRLRDNYQPQLNLKVSLDTLSQYHLTFEELARKLDEAMAQAPQDLTSHAPMFQRIANLPVTGITNDYPLKVADLVDINYSVNPITGLTSVNGEPAATVSVYQDQHSIDTIAAKVNLAIHQLETQLPSTFSVALVQDNSTIFYNRMAILQDNAIAGLLLVLLILLLFLPLRLALWITLGMPIAFIGALASLHWLGYSINMVSTFGLLLVLGIVVDDAIIIGENIDRHQQQLPGTAGAVLATQELAWPVTVAALTTILTFIPLAFLPGAEGRLIGQIPWVVIATLGLSLVECLLILPAHLRKGGLVQKTTRFLAPHRYTNAALQWLVSHVYQPLLNQVIRWRYLVASLFFASLIVLFVQIGSGQIPIHWLSNIEAEVATASVTVPEGRRESHLLLLARKLEKSALKLQDEINAETGHQEIRHVRVHVPRQGNTAFVYLSLASGKERVYRGDVLTERWKDLTGTLKQAKALDFSTRFNTSPEGFWLQLSSSDNDQLRAASHALLADLAQIDGVVDVQDSLTPIGQPVAVEMYDPNANPQPLEKQLRQVVQGADLPAVQSDSGDQEIPVRLKLQHAERNALLQLPVKDAEGQTLPLNAIALVLPDNTNNAGTRMNGDYITILTAQLAPDKLTADQLYREVQTIWNEQLAHQYPNVKWQVAGLKASQLALSQKLMAGFLLALVAMLLLMAVLFRSVLQPLLVLSAVPFGVFGAVLGHGIMGYPLTVWSMAGMVAVSGIVVNDNMVLIHTINQQLQNGKSPAEAILNAGSLRFRPIILTSVTTFGGLLPMMFDRSWESQFLVPMAIATGFGVLLATAISLLLVPVLYQIMLDLHLLRRQPSAALAD